ncbi:nuclear factor 7, brain-like [Anguilla anguilla]|uniref:nuclear factor 7, brain-like n=1 Tax=Anguilla anguilla TaxID=7936 RepID=UPI0015AE2A1B|nr:nuclear factor 7, brain-like [Anguilla anguilla]
MEAKALIPEDELCCSVCCDIFKEPVVLKCCHSFCRECVHQYWKEKSPRECPICRTKASMEDPPVNLALRSIVESYLKQKTESEADKSEAAVKSEACCSLHGQKLLLFCEEDQEPLCLVCHTSKKHGNHQVRPVEEAVLDLKEELKPALNLIKEKLKRFTEVEQECEKTTEHITSQAQHTERQIKAEFEKLHHFLREEEEARLAVLRVEEEQKSQIMKEKLENIRRHISTLTDKMTAIEKAMDTEDTTFLKSYKNIKERAQCTLQDPELLSGALIDVAKHLGNLMFKVWKKMLEMVQYTPVVLDPNTAPPRLSLSDDLTTVRDAGTAQKCLDNPERFSYCVCVLGSEGFTSGKHSWEVKVGNKYEWDIGVAKESISRKGDITCSPGRGFWVLVLRNGDEYCAAGAALTLKRKPQSIRVQLDYDRGEVSFFDSSDMSLIYTFTDTFTERVFPYFSPSLKEDGRNDEPLEICPVKVSITVSSQSLDPLNTGSPRHSWDLSHLDTAKPDLAQLPPLHTPAPHLQFQQPDQKAPLAMNFCKMEAKALIPEDELCCSVCCDIFKEPVVLKCCHSFCRKCVKQYWKEKSSRECPICRTKASMEDPPVNLALRSIVESYLKHKTESEAEKCEAVLKSEACCSLHGEKLLLFCEEDQEPLCLVCQTSKKHRNHQVCPVEEAVLDLKEELKPALNLIEEKLKRFTKVEQECKKTAGHIRNQAQHTERQIKAEFEKLHQFLREEEEARLVALKEEEKKKSRIMNEKIKNITGHISTLTEKITAIEKAMGTEDTSFLKNYKDIKMRAQCTLQDPELLSGALIDVAKHLGNLKFRVWEKMLGTVQYTPVTLDPNIASPRLSLSDDLTSVRDTGVDQQLPDNPERFDSCVDVLGSEGFNSGKHSWEVEVGNQPAWEIGVRNESANRKRKIAARRVKGFWILSLRNGDDYEAYATSVEKTTLGLNRKPQRIRVQLDYDRGELSFFDPSDMLLIFAFKNKFTEQIFPYFCLHPYGEPGAMRICPVKASVTLMP